MSLNRSAVTFNQAQAAYDSQAPDYETDADQALREWLEACPVRLSGSTESRVADIVETEARFERAA